LALHHAGIPLALFVLLQDYRFVLADAFIRLIANGLLAALIGSALVSALAGRDPTVQIVLACLALVTFALGRRGLQSWLSRIVFRQPAAKDVEASMARIGALRGPNAASEAAVEIGRLLKASFTEVAGAEAGLGAAAVLVRDLPGAEGLLRRGAAAAVSVRFGPSGTRALLLGERLGGRPYLSEDLGLLTRLGGALSDQLERLRTLEAERLATLAELRALQAQIHPHFLFNALNTVYGTIPREAAAARKTVLDLSDMFRYFLRTDEPFVPLREEVRIVEAYLAIEGQRLGGKLRTELSIDESLLEEPVPPLSIEPLVENAVKHGVGSRTEGGTVRLEIARREGSLAVTVFDTGQGFAAKGVANGAGVGLANVARRLRLCYGQGAGLQIASSAEGSSVSVSIPLSAVLVR
jgi:hypothetical protein